MAIAADASTSTDFPLRAERMLLMKRLRRWFPHPPGHFRPRWLRHLVSAGLPQQPLLQQCVVRRLFIVVLLLETRNITCAYSH